MLKDNNLDMVQQKPTRTEQAWRENTRAMTGGKEVLPTLPAIRPEDSNNNYLSFRRRITCSTHSSSGVPPLSRRRTGFSEPNRARDAGVIGDKPDSGLLIQTFHVPLFADLKGAGAINFQKVVRAANIPDFFTIPLQGGYKRSQGNNPGLEKKIHHLTDAADIFTAVFHTETQIRTKTMTHIVTIKDKGSTPQFMQPFFHRMGKCGFSRT
jgi:hypothetical protein